MKQIIIFLSMLIVAGCSTVDVKQYRDRKPVFDLYSYFQGETIGWGIVQDRKGVLLRQFVVTIQGSITENKELVLQEHFVWNDGEIQQRTWSISAKDAHRLDGTASDVVGTATGEVYGNVLNWKYYLDVKVDDANHTLHFDDWMFLQNDNVLINKTKMSKFGIHLGDITIVFNKNVVPGGRGV